MASRASAHPNTKFLNINAILNPAKRRSPTTASDPKRPSDTSHTRPSHVHVLHQTQQSARVMPPTLANGNHRETRRALRAASFSAYRKYYDEEIKFIWYNRQHLSLDWDEVLRRFNKQFPNRQRHGCQGIQSVFYRCLKRQIENHPRFRTYNLALEEQKGSLD